MAGRGWPRIGVARVSGAARVHQDLFLCAVPDQDLLEAATRSRPLTSAMPMPAVSLHDLQSLPLSRLLVTSG